MLIFTKSNLFVSPLICIYVIITGSYCVGVFSLAVAMRPNSLCKCDTDHMLGSSIICIDEGVSVLFLW